MAASLPPIPRQANNEYRTSPKKRQGYFRFRVIFRADPAWGKRKLRQDPAITRRPEGFFGKFRVVKNHGSVAKEWRLVLHRNPRVIKLQIDLRRVE
jgi:hypothetical protein